jgi:hypothetical protein
MPPLLGILGHTPGWVWVLLAVLVFFGVRALRTRTVTVWRLMIVPGVFIIWGLVSLGLRIAAAPALIVDWLAGAVLGFALAWATTRLHGIVVERERASVRLPGTSVPLLRNVAIFLAKYCLAVAIAVAPTRAGMLQHWDIAVSGFGTGYFAGWVVRFALRYRSTPLPAVAQ